MVQDATTLADRLQLVVAQQDLQGHHRRTEHWALVVVSAKNRSAYVLQLAGNMDTFHFEALRVPDVLKLGELCGGCRVGDIAADSVDKLRDKLASHRIILHDKMWDCQDWLLEAIRDLKDETGGWVQIDGWFTERGLREKLREERELWERADDHFFERLYTQT
ncbi:hypothetical protein C8Q73DRAFT_682010 [Cubamyces lactineus]|nr:hypothetical protein C8Q73DRAFT_682010 [Cubamyces lactineus]